MIKKILTFIAVFLVVLIMSINDINAQESGVVVARKLIDVQGIPQGFTTLMTNGAVIEIDKLRANCWKPECKEVLDRHTYEVTKIISDYLASDDIWQRVAQVMAQQYTAEEMNDILSFYSTPTGQKILANQGTVDAYIIDELGPMNVVITQTSVRNLTPLFQQ